MKYLRFGPVGLEKPACLDAQGQIRDLSGLIADFTPTTVTIETLNKLAGTDLSTLPIVPPETRIGACVGAARNFYAVGLNYARHARETNNPEPAEPVLFSKATSCISGPNDPIILPKGSTKTDWEVELGIVIGRNCDYVSEAEALDCVAGYCTINDVSERAYQLEQGGQWIKGKSAPSFGPIGPWLVTPDEVGDPQNLALNLSVNGTMHQSSSTADMIFGVAEIIAYMSRFMRLLPGDIIASGTPEGVGLGLNPPQFLRDGDVVELSVASLGTQRQVVQRQ
ncbi:fumarylacetoacetate hydrolase family protein [Roseobacter sp. N2S]|uniref:fumarylacetoacetate hydrolase family protein n=1 Tax=Roseobacter sp. N2S TaxID=2663844 RepID=UPI0028555A2D|nr:fumarylacetoacetate hydrolase family protein [Roseobacter sp. N2S]MDR6265797.1 2-keto-4-pentenoate hydratase/2-oxohepta-3-ene-1,7-dioic acid hydratase in catechol pathway [Roseobacter sp. N2S]